MHVQSLPGGPFEFFGPAPANYRPTFTLEEQLKHDDRADSYSAELDGFGTFVDNGWDRWHWMVLQGTPDVLTLQLQVADIISWHKRIEIHVSTVGSWTRIRSLGTQGDIKVAATDLTALDLSSGTLKLDFWKMGFLNSAAFIATQVLDVSAHLGKKVVFLCSRDYGQRVEAGLGDVAE